MRATLDPNDAGAVNPCQEVGRIFAARKAGAGVNVIVPGFLFTDQNRFLVRRRLRGAVAEGGACVRW